MSGEGGSGDSASGDRVDGARVVDAIDRFCALVVRESGLPRELTDAVEYALLGGGKRLRPRLAWMSCEAVGGAGEDSVPAGAAVELVHAFSLVHDDLPAMDDDDLRRGRPTLHKHAGEAMAILAGDQMLTLAFAALERAPAGVFRDLARELTAGTTGMIAGQTYDMALAQIPAEDPRERLETIHRHKTGALIRAACRMGAIAGGAAAADLDAVTRFGEIVGLQFQVVDDLLDAEASSEEMGKQTGKDAAAGKLTYPGVIGIERTRALAIELGERAADALSGMGEGAGPLRDVSAKLATRRA